LTHKSIRWEQYISRKNNSRWRCKKVQGKKRH